MANEAVRNRTLTKGSFILYDKISNQTFPNCTWTFLYNPAEIVNEVTGNVNAVHFSGQNWPVHYTNGIQQEAFRFTLALTGDNIETKQYEQNRQALLPQQVIQMGETSIRIAPATSSSVGTSTDKDTPNIFAEFGRKNMIYHIEHLKSLMMRDEGYEWRIIFNYGSIVPAGLQGYPNVFIMNNLVATHTLCSVDLKSTILATVEIELIVDCNVSTSRLQYLNTINGAEEIL